MTHSEKSYQQIWEENWKHICTNEDGSLNLDQIQRELADFSFMLKEVPKVYSEIAGLSKPNYYANVIISKYEDKVNESFKDWVQDFLENIEPDYKLHKGSESELDKWYADGIKFAIDELRDFAGIKES